MTAGDMPFSGHTVADFVVLHTASDIDNLSDIFMAYGHRNLDGVLGPLVPIVDMEVGAADGHLPYLDEDIVHSDFRHRDIFHPYSRFRILLDKCFHFQFKFSVLFQTVAICGGSARKHWPTAANGLTNLHKKL